MHADEIIVMDDGTIAERGTHDSLLAQQAGMLKCGLNNSWKSKRWRPIGWRKVSKSGMITKGRISTKEQFQIHKQALQVVQAL